MFFINCLDLSKKEKRGKTRVKRNQSGKRLPLGSSKREAECYSDNEMLKLIMISDTYHARRHP